MDVVSITDKQWKGWLRRLKRDLEEIKQIKDEKEREKSWIQCLKKSNRI